MGHNRVGWLFAFFLRHLAASLISIAVPIVLIVVIYFVLFLVAIVGNLPLGSPAVMPLSVLAMFLISLIYTAILLFPSVALSECMSRRLKWSPFIQIPLSTGVMVGLVYLISVIFQRLPGYERQEWLHFASHPFITCLALCLPLGLYWWSAKAIELSTWGVSSLWKKLFAWHHA